MSKIKITVHELTMNEDTHRFSYSKYEMEVSAGVELGSLADIIVVERQLPASIGKYDERRQLAYGMTKLAHREWMDSAGDEGEIAERLWNEATSYDMFETVEDQAHYVLFPIDGSGGGGGDPSTILGTVSDIAQVLIGLAALWQARQAHHRVQQPPLTIQKGSNQQTVKNIAVLMDDGSWIEVDKWVTEPHLLREFVKDFSRPDASVKPERVVFMFEDDDYQRLRVSSKTDRDNLERFMRMLGLE